MKTYFISLLPAMALLLSVNLKAEEPTKDDDQKTEEEQQDENDNQENRADYLNLSSNVDQIDFGSIFSAIKTGVTTAIGIGQKVAPVIQAAMPIAQQIFGSLLSSGVPVAQAQKATTDAMVKIAKDKIAKKEAKEDAMPAAPAEPVSDEPMAE